MIDFNNKLQTVGMSSHLQKIAEEFNRAISNKCLVEIRIEDLPRMEIDSILKTNIAGAKIDDKAHVLYINASGLEMQFKYEMYELGTEAKDHCKFYFRSQGASLTISIFR